jgi:hypothetical protein
LIDNAYNTQNDSPNNDPTSVFAAETEQIALTTAVPEPATLYIFGVAAVAVIRRRPRLCAASADQDARSVLQGQHASDSSDILQE